MTCRKQRCRLRSWFHKNLLSFILLGIILVSVIVGVVIGRATAKQPGRVEVEETIAPIVSKTSTPIYEEPHPELSFYFDIPLSQELQDYARDLCEQYDVPMELIIALIDVESDFRTEIVSETNDYGLCQINSCNHKWLAEELGVTDILDPYQNILSGIYIISGHLNATDGDVEKALMRYNNGATGAKRLWEKGIFSTVYSRKVTAAYEIYKQKTNK